MGTFDYGDPFDPQTKNRANHAEDQDQIKNDMQSAQAARDSTTGAVTGIANDQNQYFDNSIQPVENDLSGQIQAGLNPDYSAIRSSARSDVVKSFENAKQAMARRLARYGQTLTPAATAQMQYQQDRAEVGASNAAADRTRGAGFTNAANYYKMGSDLPAQASNATMAGGTGMSNAYDYSAGMRTSKLKGDLAGDMSMSSSVASMFSEGGEVRVGMGTRVGKTVDLRNKWGSYNVNTQADGLPAKPWNEWLEDQGYKLGPDNFVYKKDGMQSNSDDAAKQYADGGEVDLKTGDYIMPADAVAHYGVKFFDKMVKDHGGDPTTYRVGGSVGYADGGSVDGGDNMPLYAQLAAGLRAGAQDRQQREMNDLHIQQTKQNLSYQANEQARTQRQQAIADQADQFSRSMVPLLGQYTASGGQNYQPLVDMYNQRFPSENKLDVKRDETGNFDVGVVDPTGTRKASPKKMNTDEFGVMMHAITNPQAYYENKEKLENQLELEQMKVREYLARRGITGKGNQTNPVAANTLKIAQDMFRERKGNGLQEGDKGYLSDDEIMDQAANMAERLNSRFPAPGHPVSPDSSSAYARGFRPNSQNGVSDIMRTGPVSSYIPGNERAQPLSATAQATAPTGAPVNNADTETAPAAPTAPPPSIDKFAGLKPGMGRKFEVNGKLQTWTIQNGKPVQVQ